MVNVITYNKLVRDKIPEIIKADNKECEIEIASDEEKLELLKKKLKEEELINARNKKRGDRGGLKG